MLLREYGGGHEEGNLFAVLHGFERGAQRHFRFAVAHIAAQQAVHDSAAFHIAFDLFNALELVRRFRIRETLFELPLPRRIV